MRGILHLAWAHARFYRIRSIIVVLCTALTVFLPLTVNRLVDLYEASLRARAQATPMLLGNEGNRFDLVLKSLYFSTDYDEQITMEDLQQFRDAGFGIAIPLHLRHKGQAFEPASSNVLELASKPIVGTEYEYFDLRGLRPATGRLPAILGEVALGNQAAADLGVAVGGFVLTSPSSAYDPARAFQLKLNVVGVLEGNDTADDDAIFTDIKTAWVIDGIGHGHENILPTAGPDLVDAQRSGESNVVATAKVAAYQEITPENLEGFHFHGDPAGYSATAAIVIPQSDKMRTIASARFALDETRDLYQPTAVVEEMMGLVFKAKRFFDANLLVIGATSLLFMCLIVLLSVRLRAAEMETLFRLGSARATAIKLQTGELSMLLVAGALLAWLASELALGYAPLLLG